MGGGLRYAFVAGEIRILGFTEGSKSAINYCLTVCLAASHRFAYLLNLAPIRTRLHPFFEPVLSLVKRVDADLLPNHLPICSIDSAF
jgi:hypothetical protein